MKRRVLALVVFSAAVGLAIPQSASAIGGRSSSGGCATATAAAYTVSYVDQTVTAYKCETETKDVRVIVNEWVETREQFKYMAVEPVVTKQKVMGQELKTKQEAYKYTVMEMQPVKQMVRVCEWNMVTKDVEVMTYQNVPVVTKQKRIVCDTVVVPVVVTQTICTTPYSGAAYGGDRGGLFSRLCGKKKAPCNDPCNDPCANPCDVPVMQTVQHTVMQRQVVKREVEVDVTTMTRVPVKMVKQVTTRVPNWIEKEVTVNKAVPVQKEGTRMVNYYVPVEREIDVTSYKTVEKTDTRLVRKCVPVEKTVQQTFTKMVPYETTVKVAVCTPVAVPCPTPCPPTGMTGGFGGGRGGLLRGCCR